MEFHVDGLSAATDMAAITEAIQNIDPAAMVDIDPSTGAVRVNAAMSADDLTTAIGSAGQADGLLVMQMPSHCCGGCGG